MRLRVMSFNIRGSFVDDGENAWPARRELNVETIRKADPDLIGFQELQIGNWEDYEKALPGYARLQGPQYNNAEPFCYPSIFWKQPLLELVDSGGFWLSTTPGEFSASWNTRCVRSSAWVRLRAEDGVPLFVLNTHLDHVSEEARVEGARLIVEEVRRLRAGGEPVLITGDFNCVPGSDALNVFASAGYLDAFAAAGAEETGTFHAFTGEAIMPRIDWVLVDPGACQVEFASAEAIRDAQPPIYPSDHLPLVVDLGLSS
jgi:endonuclease/exonuclease/phosphatase family metal-dependent hydrolase